MILDALASLKTVRKTTFQKKAKKLLGRLDKFEMTLKNKAATVDEMTLF